MRGRSSWCRDNLGFPMEDGDFGSSRIWRHGDIFP